MVARGDRFNEDRVEGVAVDVDHLVDSVAAGAVELDTALGIDRQVAAAAAGGVAGGVIDIPLR